MPTINQDLKFGLQAEKTTKSILEELFGKLTKTSNKYDNFDFTNDKFYIELKTRRNTVFNQYPTLLFDEVKYDKYKLLKKQNPKLQFFVVWNLRDGLFMWEMNDNTNEFYVDGAYQVNRGTHIQTTRTVNVKNEFIYPFDDFECVIVNKSKNKI